jgi:hypothetical protein
MAWTTFTPEELAESLRIVEEHRRNQALSPEQRRQLAEHQQLAEEGRKRDQALVKLAQRYGDYSKIPRHLLLPCRHGCSKLAKYLDGRCNTCHSRLSRFGDARVTRQPVSDSDRKRLLKDARGLIQRQIGHPEVNAAAHLANVELYYQAPIKPWSHRETWYAKDRVMEAVTMLRRHGVTCWDLLAGCVAFELWWREGQPRWPQRVLDHIAADMILKQAKGLTSNERVSWNSRAGVKRALGEHLRNQLGFTAHKIADLVDDPPRRRRGRPRLPTSRLRPNSIYKRLYRAKRRHCASGEPSQKSVPEPAL